MKNKIENAVAKLATEIDKIKNKNFYFFRHEKRGLTPLFPMS